MIVSTTAFAIPVVTLTQDVATASEETLATGGFTVTRTDDGNLAQPLPVRITVTGSATINADYALPGWTFVLHPIDYQITIPGGETSVSSTITIFKDNIIEGDEDVVFTLIDAGLGTYTVGTATGATVTISDDVAEVTLTQDGTTASELTLATGGFTIQRDTHGNLAQPLTVRITVTGSATINADYALPGWTFVLHPIDYQITIPGGETSVSSTITIFKDNIIEGDEDVVFTLIDSGLSNYTIGTDKGAKVTISDDVAEVTLTQDGTTASELTLATGGFTIQRDTHGNLAQPLTVRITVTGSATINADYALPGWTFVLHPIDYQITIPGGETSVSSTITIFKDNIIEGDEDVVFTLIDAGLSNYTIGTDKGAKVTISDDVAEVTLTQDGTTASELTLATGGFTIQRDTHGNLAQPLTVRITVTGSATINADYALPGWTFVLHPIDYQITIPGGETSVSSTITIFKDNIIEGDEDVVFTLIDAGLSNYTIGTDKGAKVTISDDVAEVTLTQDGTTASELTLATGGFTIQRDTHGNLAQPLTVRITVTGSATINADYALPGWTFVLHPIDYQITIPGGETSVSSTITIFKDNIIEGDEDVVFTLIDAGLSNYTIGTDKGAKVTISDDVAEVTLTQDGTTASELTLATGGFTIQRDTHGNLAQPLTVRITVTGSATINADYALPGWTFVLHPIDYQITIPGGETSVSSTITVFSDNIIEGDEDVVFTLIDAGFNSYTVGTQTTAIVTILDLVDLIFKDSLEDK